jgi:hypothetical protein
MWSLRFCKMRAFLSWNLKFLTKFSMIIIIYFTNNVRWLLLLFFDIIKLSFAASFRFIESLFCQYGCFDKTPCFYWQCISSYCWEIHFGTAKFDKRRGIRV